MLELCHDLSQLNKMIDENNLSISSSIDMLENFKQETTSWKENYEQYIYEFHILLNECKHSVDKRLKALYYIINKLNSYKDITPNFLNINDENSFSNIYTLSEFSERLYNVFKEVDETKLKLNLRFSFVESELLNTTFVTFINPDDSLNITNLLRDKHRQYISDGIELKYVGNLFNYTAHQDIPRFINYLNKSLKETYGR